MRNFPLARTWANFCHMTNIVLFILLMFFGPTYQMLAVIALVNSVFYYTFKAEAIRATLALAGIHQPEEEKEDGDSQR